MPSIAAQSPAVEEAGQRACVTGSGGSQEAPAGCPDETPGARWGASPGRALSTPGCVHRGPVPPGGGASGGPGAQQQEHRTPRGACVRFCIKPCPQALWGTMPCPPVPECSGHSAEGPGRPSVGCTLACPCVSGWDLRSDAAPPHLGTVRGRSPSPGGIPCKSCLRGHARLGEWTVPSSAPGRVSIRRCVGCKTLSYVVN